MSARFHVPAARTTGEIVELPDDEATHVSRVLRLKRGDAVRIFNGSGLEFDAMIAATGKRGVTVRIGNPRTPAAETRIAVTMAQAVLKGDKMDDVVRDAVMLGVAGIVPVVTQRTEITRASLVRARRRERWQRVAVASAKQCARAVVPQVYEPLEFSGLIAALAAGTYPNPALMLVEPGRGVSATAVSRLESPASRSVTVIVGPEGGWADAEIAAGLAAGRLVTLGGRVLRADAAPLVALSALLTAWGEF